MNETISSLLLSYIAIALFNHLVEGLMRDPASLNKPSTLPIGDANMLGRTPDCPGGPTCTGACSAVSAHRLCAGLDAPQTTFGFADAHGRRQRPGRPAERPAGAAPDRRSRPVSSRGAAAGVAGMVEVAAVHGNANASLTPVYGYAGILVAFIARQQPARDHPGGPPLGGIGASGGLLQRVPTCPTRPSTCCRGSCSW